MNCPDCGIFREADGFGRSWPSDCHDKGGHYYTHYDESGYYLYTNAPWQVDYSMDRLTADEMLAAR